MKKIMLSKYKLYPILGALMLLGACKKTFLDLKPYDAVVISDAIKSEADVNTAINGLYSSLRATDFYGRTFALKGDLMADNAFPLQLRVKREWR